MNDPKIHAICAARASCRGAGIACSASCPWYGDLKSQIGMSGIPRRFHEINGAPASFREVVRLLAPELEDKTVVGQSPNAGAPIRIAGDGWGRPNVVATVGAGKSLYLVSRTTGTGKTTTATAIGLDFIRESVAADRKEQAVMFVETPDYIQAVKACYSDDREVAAQAAAKVASMEARMKRVPLLIVDDIGAESPTEPIRERMYTVINERWAAQMATIYTSNKSVAEVGVTLGSRIQSRLKDAMQVEFGGADQRGKGR